jgi:hypothetical protein
MTHPEDVESGGDVYQAIWGASFESFDSSCVTTGRPVSMARTIEMRHPRLDHGHQEKLLGQEK